MNSGLSFYMLVSRLADTRLYISKIQVNKFIIKDLQLLSEDVTRIKVKSLYSCPADIYIMVPSVMNGPFSSSESAHL